MFVPTLALLVALAQSLSARRSFIGNEDVTGKYPFVVTLMTQSRHCTGTFLAPNWVLTAAHCFPDSEIQKDNITITTGDLIPKVIDKNMNPQLKIPPVSFSVPADIGLLYVHTAQLKAYGILSTVDYNDLLGQTVEFADYDYYYKKWKTKNFTNEVVLKKFPELHLGQGIVRKCSTQTVAPHICVEALDPYLGQHNMNFGDPGGPLFFDGKVVGVLAGDSINIRYYTPVSPYRSWLNKLYTAPEPRFRNDGKPSIFNVDVPVPIQHQMIRNISQYLLSLKVRLKSYREEVLATLMQKFEIQQRSKLNFGGDDKAKA